MDPKEKGKIGSPEETKTSTNSDQTKKGQKPASPDKSGNGQKGQQKNSQNSHNGKNSNNGKPPRSNSYTFYAASEDIARDVASVPFNYLGGTPFSIEGEKVSSPSIPLKHDQALEAMVNIHYVPTCGIAQASTDSVNMAAVQLYAQIRKSNSGAKNYEAADVMMYVLEMKDIFSSYFEACKILGSVNIFDYFNHNLPIVLTAGYNLDQNDLRANIAQYRATLGLIAKKINSFAVPKYFKAFERGAFVSSNIFSDSSSIRGQFYQYIKEGYYTWSGVTSETGTELIYHPYDRANTKFSYYLECLEAQLDSIFLDTDALTMSGDILKAFPDSELYRVIPITLEYVTPVVFSEDALAQIENSTCMMSAPSIAERGARHVDFFNVKQEDQLISFKPRFVMNLSGIPEYRDRLFELKSLLLNSHKDNPDYKDVLEWTRGMTITNVTIENEEPFIVSFEAETCGLEVILYYSLVRLEGIRRVPSSKPFTNIVPVEVPEPGDTTTISRLMQFDWHPTIYSFINSKIEAVGADTKVATIISKDTLTRINECANYGAFYSIDMAKATTNK